MGRPEHKKLNRNSTLTLTPSGTKSIEEGCGGASWRVKSALLDDGGTSTVRQIAINSGMSEDRVIDVAQRMIPHDIKLYAGDSEGD